MEKNVWTATRICFWLLIVVWTLASIILYADENSIVGLLFSLLTCGLAIATFVLSIVHLNKYKEKGLAVTALVISGLGVLMMFFGFIGALVTQ